MTKKILVIEDDPTMLNLFKSLLTQAGYEVETAEDGKFGLEKIAEYKPDLVMLDIIMPRLTGIDVLTNLKEAPPLYDLPVIVLSGLADDQNVKKCLDLGAKDYLLKSGVHLNDIVNKVEKVLGGSKKD